MKSQKMKKLNLMFMSLLMAGMGIAFTACSSDNNDPKPEELVLDADTLLTITARVSKHLENLKKPMDLQDRDMIGIILLNRHHQIFLNLDQKEYII